MAQLGAEVVKVENPKGGEPGRILGTGPKPGADAYYFMIYNANKKSVTVNLKSPRGVALVKEMAAKADVFIENMAPGTIEKLGLGWDVLHAAQPAAHLRPGQRSCNAAELKEIGVAGEYHPINMHAVNRKFADDRIEFLRRSKHLHPDERRGRCRPCRQAARPLIADLVRRP